MNILLFTRNWSEFIPGFEIYDSECGHFMGNTCANAIRDDRKLLLSILFCKLVTFTLCISSLVGHRQ